ncbi:MAG: N-acetyl-gamma-glutamyl-phosphate reductase [Ruminococcaceae bacterium]|nr:N-acetyl-gamma-glutamyl-phosphate reductase [Oscillospiraceae bacterium]
MIKVSIVGATGYAGVELLRLLCGHGGVEIKHLVSKSFAGQRLSEIYSNFSGKYDFVLSDLDIDEIVRDSDVVFTALPHGASQEVITKLYEKGVKIIDFSGDFRYDDPEVYEKWYEVPHTNPELLKKAVYGLCELHRDKIKNADLVGNPGCYTTCSILASAPLLKNGLIDEDSIIIDAKSGVSGAGRSTNLSNSFCERTENMKAYKIATHRHTSEIEQELSKFASKDIMVSFTPHLIPLKRGILATVYANLKKDVTDEDIYNIYKEFYKNEYFVRVYEPGQLPETNHVAGSNFIDIGFKVDKRLKRVVITAVIDNIVKGAAGQALQNMNIMFGLEETTGLDKPGFYL